jgi:hypothetical protein
MAPLGPSCTSALIGPSISFVNFLDHLRQLAPFLAMREGLVVTPVMIPQVLAVRISSRFAVSIKNSIVPSPSLCQAVTAEICEGTRLLAAAAQG